MSWSVVLDNEAKKFLKKIPRKDFFRISDALEEFAENPFTY